MKIGFLFHFSSFTRNLIIFDLENLSKFLNLELVLFFSNSLINALILFVHSFFISSFIFSFTSLKLFSKFLNHIF